MIPVRSIPSTIAALMRRVRIRDWRAWPEPAVVRGQDARPSSVGSGRPVAMTATDCALCGSAAPPEVLFENLPSIDGRCRIVRCPDCQLVFLSPRTAEISDSHWNTFDYLTDCVLAEFQRQGRLTRARRFSAALNDRHFKAVLRALTPGSSNERAELLDVGCSLGTFVLAAGRAGWRARGLEPSAVVATYGKLALSVRIEVGTADGLDGSHVFDCATMTDVLEHTLDPLAALRGVRRALRPGGTVFLAVPNFEAASCTAAGRDWAQFVADHYYHFTGDTLAAVLAKAGFAAVVLMCDHAVPFARLGNGQPARLLADAPDGAVRWCRDDRSRDALYAWARA